MPGSSKRTFKSRDPLLQLGAMGGQRRIIAGRYELIEPIGSGAYGSVWVAWDRRASEWVAIKILKDSGEEAVQRFIREQRILLVNPHISAPTDVGFDTFGGDCRVIR